MLQYNLLLSVHYINRFFLCCIVFFFCIFSYPQNLSLITLPAYFGSQADIVIEAGNSLDLVKKTL